LLPPTAPAAGISGGAAPIVPAMNFILARETDRQGN